MQAQVKRDLPDSKATINEAVALSERALALDPQNGRALTVLANALASRVLDHWSDDPAGDIARAEKTVDAALALHPENSWAHFTKGQIYYTKRQFGPSITELETMIALDPNNAWGHALAGFRKVYLGRAEDGFAGLETALRLDPRNAAAVPRYQYFMCALHNYLAHWDKAIPWCEKSIAGNPQVFQPYVMLAAANAWAGHMKEANEAAAQLLKVHPGFTMQTWAGRHMSDDPTYNAQYQRITEGLRKAGLPEGDKKTN
jgi:tetratricopeptide (TPR) repeat protein